jgi:hypothetical protein
MDFSNSKTFKAVKLLTYYKPVVLVPSLLLLSGCLFLLALCIKFVIHQDSVTDTLKLTLVSLNGLIAFIISLENYQVLSTKKPLAISIALLFLCILISFGVNVYELNVEFMEAEEGFIDQGVLAMSFLTDLAFLLIYIFFESSRAIWMSGVMIVVEIVMFILAFTIEDDSLIDYANLTVAFMTSFLSLILWSGRLVVLESGETKFYDLYEHLELDVVDSLMAPSAASAA